MGSYLPGTSFDFATESVCTPSGVFLYRFGKTQVEARVVRSTARELIVECRRRGECIWKRAQATPTVKNLRAQIRLLVGRRINLL